MIDKKNVKACLKEYGFIMISKSWFAGRDNDGTKDYSDVLFNAYTDNGHCYEFYINDKGYATYTMLSSIVIHEALNATYMFESLFKEKVV